MTVEEMVKSIDAKILCGEADTLTQTVTGGYCGDLLSWVMGRAPAGGVWITIMSNLNVAAVALLSEVSCVIFAEGVMPDEALQKRAENEGIVLISSEKSTFRLAGEIYALLNA